MTDVIVVCARFARSAIMVEVRPVSPDAIEHVKYMYMSAKINLDGFMRTSVLVWWARPSTLIGTCMYSTQYPLALQLVTACDAGYCT